MKMIKLLATAVALLCCTGAYAQFTSSAVGESIAASITAPLNSRTFNDCRTFKNVGAGTIMVVNAVGWVGANAGVYWEVPMLGASGTIPLPSGITQGDIAFSTDASLANLYMTVVYYDGSSNFIFEAYQWNGTTFIMAGANPFANMPGAGTPVIMIDATRNGDFAISMNHSDGRIDVATGSNMWLPSILANVPVVPPGTATQADICLNTDPFGTTTDIHLAFSDGINSQIYTTSAPYASLAFSAISVIVPNNGASFNDLHIASPVTNAPSCPGTEIFSVIYNEVMPNFSYIHQYSEDVFGMTDRVLSGGAPGMPSPAIPFSQRPGITYNEQWSYTLPGTLGCLGATASGWSSSFSSPASLIGEKNYSNGNVFGPVTYYNIDNPQRFNCDQFAISSKYAGDQLLVSYMDNNVGNVIYKVLSYSGATMKAAPGRTITGEMQKAISIYPNPASDRLYVALANFADDAALKVVVRDMTGGTVYVFNDQVTKLETGVNSWLNKAVPGLYAIEVSDNEGYDQVMRLVKQ